MRVLLLSLLCLATAITSPATAQSAADEATGVEAASTAPTSDHQALPASARALTSVIAVVESTNDQVILLDPDTGNLLTAAFLTDGSALSTPIEVCPDTDGSGLLITDQFADGVFRYSGSGEPEGLFAPAGGVDNTILDNMRGCATEGTKLYVANAGGANADAVAAFDATGAFTGNFIANGSGGLDGPWDVLLRTVDVLVPASDSDNILRYDRATGAFLDVFATGVPFTEQIAETSTGTILGASFTPGQIDEYSAVGAPIGSYTYSGLSGFRGVYELPSGALIVTNGGGVHEVLRNGTIVRTIVSGVSGRFVSLLPTGFIVADEGAAPVVGAALRVAGANPFRVQTTLTLTVEQAQAVRVTAYDVTGRRVATLFDGTLAAGTAHVLTLHGSGLPAGVYAVQAVGETFTASRSVTHVE